MTIRPQDLGDPSFRNDLGLEYNYLAGAMANGIASVELVAAMARTGMLGFLVLLAYPFPALKMQSSA